MHVCVSVYNDNTLNRQGVKQLTCISRGHHNKPRSRNASSDVRLFPSRHLSHILGYFCSSSSLALAILQRVFDFFSNRLGSFCVTAYLACTSPLVFFCHPPPCISFRPIPFHPLIALLFMSSLYVHLIPSCLLPPFSSSTAIQLDRENEILQSIFSAKLKSMFLLNAMSQYLTRPTVAAIQGAPSGMCQMSVVFLNVCKLDVTTKGVLSKVQVCFLLTLATTSVSFSFLTDAK